MKIIRFSKYNESLEKMNSYSNIIEKYNKLDKDIFEDRYMEVIDLGVSIKSFNITISDENGNKTYLDILKRKSTKCHLSYIINLEYDVDDIYGDSMNRKNIKIENLQKIYNKHLNINNLISNISKNISRIYNLKLIDIIVYPMQIKIDDELVDRHSYLIKFITDEIPKLDVIKMLSEYKNSYYEKGNKALSKIKKYLEGKYNIKNPDVDFNWEVLEEFDFEDNENYLPCGFFTDDEIVVIAHWKPKDDTIWYDLEEIERILELIDGGII